MRIISSAIVAFAGAISIGLTANAPDPFAREVPEALGSGLLVVGGVCFVVEFVRTWNSKN